MYSVPNKKTGTRNVIGHVTIRLATGHFLLVPHCNEASISSRFRDTGPIGVMTLGHWGHNLDLLGSRDVIGHVTIRPAICHFLLAVLWNQIYL